MGINTMYLLITQLAQYLATRRARLGHAVVPRRLLEAAEVRAGTSGQQAQELRAAALAYLRVVR